MLELRSWSDYDGIRNNCTNWQGGYDRTACEGKQSSILGRCSYLASDGLSGPGVYIWHRNLQLKRSVIVADIDLDGRIRSSFQNIT